MLEITVTASPAVDMPLMLIGLNVTNTQALGWTSASVTWSAAPFAVYPSVGVVASPVNNFMGRIDNGNLVAGHVTVLAGTPVRDWTAPMRAPTDHNGRHCRLGQPAARSLAQRDPTGYVSLPPPLLAHCSGCGCGYSSCA